MTIVHRRATARQTEDGSVLAARCRRTGDWRPAGAWLADRLNEIDATPAGPALGAEARWIRRDAIDHQVGLVDGDWREIDLIYLADGTRVCWHLGATRDATTWVVEGRGDRLEGAL